MSGADVRSRRRTGRAARFAAGVAIAAGVLAPTAAFAVEYPTGGNPPTQQQPAGTQARPTSATRGASLPFTGGDVAGLAAIGGAAAVAGGLLVRRSRRARVQG